MKTQLFFALALTGIFALNAQKTEKEAFTASRSDAVVKLDDSNIDVVTSVVDTPSPSLLYDGSLSAPAAAEGDEGESDYVPLPFFHVNGMFYDGVISDEGSSFGNYYYNRYGYYPPFAKITYSNDSYFTGTRPENFTWEWSVPKITNVDLTAGSCRYLTMTGDELTYTADFETPFFPWAISLYPSLTMDGVTYRTGYTNSESGAEYYGSQFGGKRVTRYSDADVNLFLTYYPANTLQAYNAIDSYYGVANSVRITGWDFAKPYFTDVTDNLSCALILDPCDYGVYGFDRVAIKAYISSLAAGGKFKLDIFKYTYDASAKYWAQVYALGERLGGGYISTDEYASTSGVSFITIPVLDIEGEGDEAIESSSFFNVTEPVIIAITLESADGASDSVLPFPVFSMDSTSSRIYNSFRKGGVFVEHMSDPAAEEGDTSTFQSFYPTFVSSKTIGGCPLRQIGWDIYFDLQYSYLFNDGSHPELSCDLPAEGGTHSFSFTPLISLYEAKYSFTNNDDEWLFAYADNDLADDGTQNLIVEAEALPDGVAGRVSVVTVEIKGALQTITVRQGDTSGLGTIDGDAADIVSSRLYDLQGRQLNAVPESGLYIRRDVKADNTVTTSKLLK